MLEQVVRDHFGTCLQEDLFRVLRISVPNASLLPALQRHAATFLAKYNVSVKLNVLGVADIAAEVRGEAQQQLQGFSDGWVVDPSVTGDLAAAGALANLTSYVFGDGDLAWPDMSKFFRLVAAYFNKRIVGVPLDGDMMLMYYRQDLFERYGLSVPVTWEEFADVAEQMNGTDTDGDSIGDLWGVCFDNSPITCKSLWILTAVLAPYVQYMGTPQGVYIDPATMKPLINTAATARAVEIYRRLFAVAPRPDGCHATNPFFNNGTCLMTINFGDQFKVGAAAANASQQQPFNANGSAAKLGVSRLPGSTQVLNRTSGQLVPCGGAGNGGAATCPYAQWLRLASGGSAWVNFAPFSAFGGWTGMVNARAPAEYQQWAYRFFSHVSQPANSLPDVLDPASGVDPYRTSQLQPGLWTAAGYDATATLSYLAATGEALEHENTVLDIRLQSVSDVTRLVMACLADNTTWGGQPVPRVLATGQAMMEAAINGSGVSPRALQVQYWQLLGYSGGSSWQGPPRDNGSSSSGGAAADASSGRGLSTQTVVLLSVLIPVGALLLALAVGLVVWRRVSGHRDLLYGGIRPPAAGVHTSLLITDIQDSTSLWEALPDDVMDAALRTHHAVVRQALTKHNGYESATEGDSFILTFHSPEDAVACAMRIQTDLLAAPWPTPLLRCTECASAGEVWVAPSARSPHQHSALLEMLGGAAPCELRVGRRGHAVGGGGGGGDWPFCIVRSCWQAIRAGAGPLDRPATPRESGTGGGATAAAGWGQVTSSRLSGGGGGGSWRRHTNSGGRGGGGGGGEGAAGAAGGAGGALGQQKMVEFAETALVLGGESAGSGGSGPGSGPGTGGGRVLLQGAGAEPEGYRAGAEPQPTFSSAGQFGRLSTFSGMADEDVTTASNAWSASHEGGFLSRGSSMGQIREFESPDAGSGVLGAVSGFLSLVVPRTFLARRQHRHQQHYQPMSSAVLTTEKPDHLYGKTWFGGGACTGGITAAGVVASAAAGAAAGAPGFDSGRLLMDHIRSVWLVVEPLPPPPPSAAHTRCSTRQVTDTGAVAAAAVNGGGGSDLAALPPAPPLLQGRGLRLSLRDFRRSFTAATTAIDARFGGGGGAAAAAASPPAPIPGVAVELSGSPCGPLALYGGGSLSFAASPAATAAATPPATPPAAAKPMQKSVSFPSASSHASCADVAQCAPLQQQQQPSKLPGPPQQQASLRGLAAEQAAAAGLVVVGAGAGSGARPPVNTARQVLAFRGLRVRMGIHSGVPDPGHVLYNQAEARYHYSGIGMAIARAVQGAAAGGQVLLSDATFAMVRDAAREGKGKGKGKRLRDAVLIHAGEHELDLKLPGAQQVYQALPRQLLCRLPLQPPLKVIRTVAAGALDAPVGRVAVAFLSVVGTATLQAWNPDVTRRSLALFQGVFGAAAAGCAARGAYVVEATGGLLLAAFASAADALATCMALQVGLRVAEWPPELLEHDMCEQVTIATPQVEGTIVREVLFRGLRVKAGVDYGPARAALNGATGRIAYRGRVMNRAARINAQGSSGQVLCSSAAWQAASDSSEGGPAARGLAALSLGPVVLKGIGEPLEIFEVRPVAPPPPPGASATPPGASTILSRLMMPSQQSASLAPLPSPGGAATATAAVPAAVHPLMVTAPAWGPTSSINRRSATVLSSREDMTAADRASSVTAVAVAVAAVGPGPAPAPAPAGVSPFATVAAAAPLLPPPATTTWDQPASRGPSALGLVGQSSAALCDDVEGGGGRDSGDGAAAAVAAPAAAAPPPRSGGSFISRVLPPPLSLPSHNHHVAAQAAPTPNNWLMRTASRRRGSASMRLAPPSAADSAPSSSVAAGPLPPVQTVQVFRVDASTGIAALELPSPGVGPSPLPRGHAAAAATAAGAPLLLRRSTLGGLSGRGFEVDEE